MKCHIVSSIGFSHGSGFTICFGLSLGRSFLRYFRDCNHNVLLFLLLFHYKMWVYDSPIGPLYIVRTDDGQYGFLYNGIIWEACPTPQVEADNVYCRATGCAAASDLEELPHDLSEWTYVPR